MLKSSGRSDDTSCNEKSSDGHKSIRILFVYVAVRTNINEILIDGTPSAVKVACSV
jgi:hypothetical protein